MQAALGKEGVFYGTDYRNVRVLSVLKRIPDSPWVMVTKIDEAEALEDWRHHANFILTALTALVLALGAAMVVIWREHKRVQVLERAEGLLRAAGERRALATRVGGVGIWDYDVVANRLVWDDQMFRLHGITRDQFSGAYEAWQSGLHPEDKQRGNEEIQLALQGEKDFDTEFRVLWPDGSIHDIRALAAVQRDATGKALRMVGTNWDFTERKRAEEEKERMQAQIYQARKMESVGHLAGGVAHDFNNLLMVVGGYASLLLKRLPEEHPGYRMIGEIRKSVVRGGALTQQLLAFGGKQVTQIRRIGLNQVVEESRNMLKQLLPENVQMIQNCAPDLVPVMGDFSQMGQVLMNLIINARDAMPKGGTLTLETENMDARSTVSLGFESVPEGKYARLTVRDDGAGMTREVQSHLFEPFFTTKEKGKGTGLGLSIVHGIVVRLGGYLVVQSQVGKGSAFHILLPEAQETPAVKPESSLPKPKMEANTETILLVEDEEMLRRVTTEILRSEGYRVIHAGEAKEALLALNDSSVKIHLMLSDVVMPGMQGTDLAEEALRLRPEIKVILMSGYSENRIMDQMISRNEVLFLSKPIPEEHLLRKLREVLGRM